MNVGFDLDGVLLDSESDRSWLNRALDAALVEVGLSSTREHRRLLGPGHAHEFASVAATLGADPDVLWETRNRHYTREKVAAIESGELRPFDDADAVATLADHSLFVVSNSPQEVVDAFLCTDGFDDLFDVAIGRGPTRADLDSLKPDTHFYERVLETLGPGEYVYVGDAETDREFATNAGMRYLHLDRPEQGLAAPVAELRQAKSS